MPQQMPGMMPMNPMSQSMQDNQEEDEMTEEEEEEGSVEMVQQPDKQSSPPKKTSKAKKTQHESPLKKEVALLQETGKMSPLNPRRAAEKAKKALITNKVQVKPVDSAKDKSHQSSKNAGKN